MNILITGAAGFIGFHLVEALKRDNSVVCIDNLNDYYDVRIKNARLQKIGFDISTGLYDVNDYNVKFYKESIESRTGLEKIFAWNNIDMVIHLAAQAGVRYSKINQDAYIDSNVTGFVNILEMCREFGIKKIIYASSSSVYGATQNSLSSETDRTDTPVSLYAATKKFDELCANVYGNMYNMSSAGLRFFTAFGPFGRPDMALHHFCDAIYNGEQITINNNGMMFRDFTYIYDLIDVFKSFIDVYSKDISTRSEVYNIGSSRKIWLTEFVETIESVIGKKAITVNAEMQDGDVIGLVSDNTKIEEYTGREISVTPLIEAISEYWNWHKSYYYNM